MRVHYAVHFNVKVLNRIRITRDLKSAYKEFSIKLLLDMGLAVYETVRLKFKHS